MGQPIRIHCQLSSEVKAARFILVSLLAPIVVVHVVVLVVVLVVLLVVVVGVGAYQWCQLFSP